MKRKELVEAFKNLGALEPEVWADTQIRNGTPELQKFAFLKKSWDYVAGYDDNHEWIGEALKTEPGMPGYFIVQALNEILGRGVSKRDLSSVVRVMQWDFLAKMLVMIDDPGSVDLPPSINWALFALDDEDRPIANMSSLVESLLELEPSGSELTANTTLE